MKIRVTRVEMARPPIMATLSGDQSSEPVALDKAIGSMPKIVVRVVISTGRRRWRPAMAMA